MRERAATDFATNLIVLAGAGTGKTSLLIERMLVALGSGIATLPEIAAITFTEMAAGELHARLSLGLTRLHVRATGAEGHDPEQAADRAYAHLTALGIASATVAERALAAFDALPGAAITTIHGFCVQVLRTFPREAGLPPGFTVDAAGEGAQIFDEAWADLLQRSLGPEGTEAAAWNALLEEMPLRDVKELARALSEPAISESLLEEPYLPADARTLFGPEARALAEGAPGTLYAEGCLALAEGGLPAFHAFLAERGGADEVLDDRRVPEPAKRARSFLKDLLDVDEAGFAAAHARVAPLALEVRRRRRSRGLVGFDELLAATARLLRVHPEVRERLRGRFRMLLVDEFQDTDPLQYEIVLFLAEAPGGRASDAYAAELAPGRLFLVGDPKQSIYRFRGADYAALARVLARVRACGGEELQLEDNWRSVEQVLAPVHALFTEPGSAVWRTQEGYQPPYVPVRAARGRGGEGSGVEIWSVSGVRPGPLPSEERRRVEGRILARALAEGVQEGRFELRDVTVLLRAFTGLRHLLRPLREAGIPFVVSGGREFLDRPEIVGTLAVLRAVAHPGDPAAVLAFLRSPVGGVPDDVLAEFAEGQGRWSASQRVDGKRFPAVGAALARLRGLQEATRGLPADAAVRRVIADTRLPTLHACAFEGAQRIANLRKLASTAAELGRDGKLSLLEILDAIEAERGSDPDGESPLADEGMNAVRILTVHAAKGLEGKVVFVPDLAAAGRVKERKPPKPGAEAARLPRGPALALRIRGRSGLTAVWQKREEDRHEEAEEARILYVALTRARERLIVLCGASTTKPRWGKVLEPWGYVRERPPQDGAALLRGHVLHRNVADCEDPLPSLVAAPPAADPLLVAIHAARLSALGQAARPPLRVPSALELERVWPEGAGTGDRGTARAVGTAVHRVLEGWPEAASPRRQAAAARVAAHAVEADPRQVERETAAILSAFGRSPLAARLQAIEVLGREVPVLLQDGPAAWRGTLDLLYREGDEVVVADYKTDRDEDEVVLRARYAGQLDVYARAVAEAMRLPRLPRRELWLLRAGRVVSC
ncbi:MAG TPA: UvrD-helicase domain-containing protein [Candidatus Polarisedimenticolaceae bacterium]|nr:UvrD-helicase domain-containing protein [Candidatus Polarisedimenticolaceae bacterium]